MKKKRWGEAHSLTSDFSGKMGWFMLHLQLCKASGPLMEVSDSQVTCQDRHECQFWKAREAEVVITTTSHGDQKSKVKWSLWKVWLPGPLTQSDRTSQVGRRRWLESCRNPRPGFSQSASRWSPGDHPPPGCPGCGRNKAGHEMLKASLWQVCSVGKEVWALGDGRLWMGQPYEHLQLICARLP